MTTKKPPPPESRIDAGEAPGPTDFAGAVQWAKLFLATRRMSHGYDKADAHAAEIAVNAAVGWRVAAISSQDGMVQEAVQAAEDDTRVYKSLLLGIAFVVEQGGELHPELRAFLVRHLRGAAKAPPGRPGAPIKEERDQLIVRAIRELKRADWKPTRNSATSAASGCDVLAEATLGEGFTPLGYSGVEKIWKRRDKLLD